MTIKRKKAKDVRISGIGVSSGIAIGKVYHLDRTKVKYTPRFIRGEKVKDEILRFNQAVKKSENQLDEAKGKIPPEKFQEFKHIIEAHLLILKDRMLNDETIKTIKTRHINSEWALKIVHEKLNKSFEAIDDEYLAGRASDIDYVVERIMRNLTGKDQECLSGIDEDVIVVAHDLSPADTAQIDRSVIKGFVTDIGGRTSHTAIMARSLEIPAVVGLEEVSQSVNSGDCIIVNGSGGEVIINPSPSVVKQYEKKLEKYLDEERELLFLKDLSPVTTDGHEIRLMANIEMPHELESIEEHGAQGIGLYRTEFIYLNRRKLPTEDEHFEVYKTVVEWMRPEITTIRTFDLGGDRFLSQLELAKEMNPAMGLRAIRFCLKEVEIFKDQLKAILRASNFGPVRVMFPMISGMEEIRRTKEILEEAKGELRSRGVPFDEGIKIGMMMEVPSAMAIADFLAEEVDFFSIGTNDLIQYSLAIDRVNEHVNYLYEPLHPAVLRMIKGVVKSAHVSGITIGMCGEMAGEPLYLPILVGMGLDELSMNALSILRVKKILRSVSYKDCREIAKNVLTFSTAKEIDKYVLEEMRRLFPDDFGETKPSG
ncbi:MAG: phosphoenolpyruvate--protein phosphotransferase [Deltaproteobacteria bacterium]|uniref:Phosphoenolpyruvate-protein phosphotransferase n=1 Tax=Candidatus Zymogenus saltonus TaxID=2844893 RepID=A0A9D8PQ69_9DELT|nr:phosphoenolpyruvate--protein phosphotransferase [Candidatus Zymogenus saltonus]